MRGPALALAFTTHRDYVAVESGATDGYAADVDRGHRKMRPHRKARMDQRTRERLPVLPALVQAAERQARNVRPRLDALRAASPDASFEVLEETCTKPAETQRADPAGMNLADDAAGRGHDIE